MAAEPLYLTDTPGYPLARSVEMPESIDYDTGELSIRFGALEVNSEGTPELVSAQEVADGTRITYRIPALTLTGRYALDARPDPISRIDTAGDLRPLSEEAMAPTLPSTARTTGMSEPPPLADRKRWLKRGDEHRDKLLQSENGRDLLRLTAKHNEEFHSVFKESSTLRDVWPAGGATRRMSEHTWQSTDPAAPAGEQPVVNEWKDPHNPDVTYDRNAWAQRTNVQTALTLVAKRKQKHGMEEQAQRYLAAAHATEGFSKAVITGTGNSPERSVPMKQHEIYAAVDQHQGGLPDVSDQEMQRYDPYGGSVGGDAEELPEGWVPLTQDDFARIQMFGRAEYHLEASEQPDATDTLHWGACSARLENVEISLNVPGGDAAQAPDPITEVSLPTFALHIADDDWSGTVGEVARERLGTMRFVRELVRDSLVQTVRHAATSGMTGWGRPSDEES